MPRVSNLKEKAVYGIVTHDYLAEIFGQRLLTADYLSHSRNRETAHAARMVMLTLQQVRKELEGTIS